MDAEASAVARIVRNATLGMAVGAVASVAAIAGYVSRDYTSLDPDLSLEDAKMRLLAARRNDDHVVDAGGVYLGTLKLAELLAAEGGRAGEREGRGEGREGGSDSGRPVVRRLARREEPLLTPQTSVWSAMKRMGDFVGETIPVLEKEGGGRMLGVVSEAAVVKAYRDTMDETRREENAGA